MTAPSPGDEDSVWLTRYQAQECAAIILAYGQGHEMFRDATRDVAALLQVIAGEGYGLVSPTRQEAWDALDALPWPRPGGPKSQPD